MKADGRRRMEESDETETVSHLYNLFDPGSSCRVLDDAWSSTIIYCVTRNHPVRTAFSFRTGMG